MAKKCVYIYKDGRACKAWARKDSDLCITHDPRPAKRPKRLGTDTLKGLPPLDRKSILMLVGKAMREVEAGNMTHLAAGAIAQLAKIQLAILKAEDAPESLDSGTDADIQAILDEHLGAAKDTSN